MKIRIFTTRLAILAEEDLCSIYQSSFKRLGATNTRAVLLRFCPDDWMATAAKPPNACRVMEQTSDRQFLKFYSGPCPSTMLSRRLAMSSDFGR